MTAMGDDLSKRLQQHWAARMTLRQNVERIVAEGTGGRVNLHPPHALALLDAADALERQTEVLRAIKPLIRGFPNVMTHRGQRERSDYLLGLIDAALSASSCIVSPDPGDPE